MLAETLLKQLEKMGVELFVQDDRLKFRANGVVIPDDIRQAMRDHKQELFDLVSPHDKLQRQQAAFEQRIEAMLKWLNENPQHLDFGSVSVEYARLTTSGATEATRQLIANGYVRIRSHVLNEDVLFVLSDQVKIPPKWSKLIRYTIDELEELRKLTPEHVKMTHEVKKKFGGSVVPEVDPFDWGDSEIPDRPTKQRRKPVVFASSKNT